MSLITRTTITLNVKALVANLDTNKVEEQTFNIPKVKENKIQKEIEKILPANLKFVSVVSAEDKETLYGIEESVFLQNAIELDPVTRRPLKAEKAEN